MSKRTLFSRFFPYVLVLCILVVATWLRAYQFNAWPPGLSHDEAINGMDAIRLSRTGVIPLYAQDGRPEPLFRFVQAITVGLIGPTRFGLRIASLYMGVLAVAAAYRAGRHLSPPDQPESRRWFGLLAAGVLTIILSHVHLSRVAYRAIPVPFALLMFFDTFIAAWKPHLGNLTPFRTADSGSSSPSPESAKQIGVRERSSALERVRAGVRSKSRWTNFLAAGLWMSVAMLSYTAGFIVLPLALIGLIVQLALAPRQWVRSWKGILLFLAAFAITISPLIIMWVIQPTLFVRAAEVGNVTEVSLSQRLNGLSRNLLNTWQSVNQSGDINPQYNAAQAPLLHFAPFYWLLWVGIGACVLRPRRLSSWLTIALLIGALMPVALANEIPHGLRIVAMSAALPLAIAPALDPILWIARRLPEKAQAGWRAAWGLIISAGLIVGMVQATNIYFGYFQSDIRWGDGGVVSAFSWFFETQRLAVSEAIAAQDGVIYTPIQEPEHPSMRFFTTRSHPRVETFATYFGTDAPLILPAGRFLIPYWIDNPTTFAAFMPDGTLVLLPRFDERTLAALSAARASSDQFLMDANGEQAATIVDFPVGGSDIVLEQPVNHPVQINYGGQVNLVGWDAPSALPMDGGRIDVTLYFAPGEAAHRDLTIFTQIWTLDAERLASGDEKLLLRWLYPPGQWQAGDIVPYVNSQPVPEGLNYGAYHLAVGLRNYRLELLPVLGADGSPVADTAVAGALKVPRLDAPSTEGMIPVEAEFGDQIRLIGYEISGGEGAPLDTIGPGEPFLVTLYWQAVRQPDTDYTVFLHVHDGADTLIAQNDAQPDGGRYPTGIWAADEIVISTHPLQLPEDAAGPFTLYTGLYSFPSLERLPVEQKGQDIEDRRATVVIMP